MKSELQYGMKRGIRSVPRPTALTFPIMRLGLLVGPQLFERIFWDPSPLEPMSPVARDGP